MDSKIPLSSSESLAFFTLPIFHHINESFCRRHLIRLWQRDPENAWVTPEQLSRAWKSLYDGITPESQVFPLEPYVRGPARGAFRDKAAVSSNGRHLE